MGNKLVTVVMLVKVGQSVEMTEEKPESEEMVELGEERWECARDGDW
jgi:hypothetical protein